jgi:hypothetical protein|tara:strand:+ start:36 stop:500 length:465 start_codon:yes stop_codon:yes gene_type:complete
MCALLVNKIWSSSIKGLIMFKYLKKLVTYILSRNIYLVRLKAKNNKHHIYIPACSITEKLSECNEKPFFIESDFIWIKSINKRFYINIYTEEYFIGTYASFNESFCTIFFKYLSRYSNAHYDLLDEPNSPCELKGTLPNQPITDASINRPESSY